MDSTRLNSIEVYKVANNRISYNKNGELMVSLKVTTIYRKTFIFHSKSTIEVKGKQLERRKWMDTSHCNCLQFMYPLKWFWII